MPLGKASELHPMERIERATAMVDLAGGPENVVEKMKEAYEKGQYQWALELAEICIDTENSVKVAKVMISRFFLFLFFPITKYFSNFYYRIQRFWLYDN